MAGHGLDRRSYSALRGLALVADSAADVDPDDVNQSLRQLPAGVVDLDVECVTLASSPRAPLGTRGVDPVGLVCCGGDRWCPARSDCDRSGLAFRHATARRILLAIDGDTIVLKKSSAQEQCALIKAYLRHHEAE